ncbi:MAG TPA: hypothetical protein VGF34_21080 [Stellaceae bacterium]
MVLIDPFLPTEQVIVYFDHTHITIVSSTQDIDGRHQKMGVDNRAATGELILAGMAKDWKDTARQQTVHLGQGVRVIVSQDRQGRIFAARTDRHGGVVARAELKPR